MGDIAPAAQNSRRNLVDIRKNHRGGVGFSFITR